MQADRPIIDRLNARPQAAGRGRVSLGLLALVAAGALVVMPFASSRDPAPSRAAVRPEASVEHNRPTGGQSVRTVAVSSELEGTRVALLCLGLAALLLMLRHARLRVHEQTRAEATGRELQLVQSQLIQSEKLAAIGQLAAGVAHEMNTPLGFVACNLEILESHVNKVLALLDAHERLTQEAGACDQVHGLRICQEIRRLKERVRFDFIVGDLAGLFEDSKDGLERVTNVIQSLRDFSRVDQVGDLARYSINDGLAATLTVAGSQIKSKAQVGTEFGAVPEVCCDPGQINQVFLNLLVNAAQAIESQQRRSPGHITVRTFAQSQYVVCEIEDDGPGIAADVLGKVFDPFFTTRPPGQGAGLGLSVAHDIIVNKHKGQLFVESDVGKGAKFTIRLPLTQVDAPA